MNTTRAHASEEPFFQFDPFEVLDSTPMDFPPNDSYGRPLDDSSSIEMDGQVALAIDKGKQASRPLPIAVTSAPESLEFDDFGTSPACSVSSSYPDTPNAATTLHSPATSSIPSFTLGSLSSVWPSSSSGFNPDTLAFERGSPSRFLGQNDTNIPTDRKGKGKEREVDPLSSSVASRVGLQESAVIGVSFLGTETGLQDGQSAPPIHLAPRTFPLRRHSIPHSPSRHPSSLTRFKARFSSTSRFHARKVSSKKLPTPPARLAIPQLTQPTNVHMHSPTPLTTEVQLSLDEGVMETTELCLSMHTMFKAKGRSNSSPFPLSALDYVPVVSQDVFVPITLSRNLFDVVLPKELKLLILSLLIASHEGDQRKLLVQTDQWSVTKAISSKYRWLGKDKAARELVKLSRVNKSWKDLVYDGQLWSTLDFHSFPAMSKTTLLNIAKGGGHFINSIDLSGHVHVSPATLVDITNICLPSVSTSLPFTQLTSINFRGCTTLSTRSIHYLLVRSPGLQQVCFRGLQSVTNTTCDIIAMYCPRITKLDLNRCRNMDAEGLKRLASAVKARGDLLQLTELKISGLRNIDDDTMALVGQVAPFLEVLDLSYSRELHNSALAALVSVDDNDLGCETVLLTAREAGREPNDSSRYRRRVTRLRHLSLSSCALLTDIACSHLAHAVPRLEFLELAGIGEELGDDGLVRLLKTTRMIRRLDLEDASLISDAVLNAITPRLPESSNGAESVRLQPGGALEHLVISYASSITDGALLSLIRRCPCLKALEADNTRMGPDVLQKFCELQRPHSKIVAVDCRNITESQVKELAPLVRPRRGWRRWDARKLRFLDGRDFGAGQNSGETDKDKEAVMKVALGQDELDEKRVVIKTFYSWQLVDAVWAAREKRRKAIARRKANESSGSMESDSGDVDLGRSGRSGGIRWWSPGGRRSRSASGGSNSPLMITDPNGGDTCVTM